MRGIETIDPMLVIRCNAQYITGISVVTNTGNIILCTVLLLLQRYAPIKITGKKSIILS